MKSRPILFSGPMVRALLGGTKTQTRRIMKPEQSADIECFTNHEKDKLTWLGWYRHADGNLYRKSWDERCPYGMPGDQLWVRETWQAVKEWHHGYTLDIPHAGGMIRYRATDDEAWVPVMPWRPSIFMPRYASRITLEITGVRVERLNYISANDALAEGVSGRREGGDTDAYWVPPPDVYRELWESINGPGSWALNPFVWVITFKRIKP